MAARSWPVRPERVIRHRRVEPDGWQLLGLEGEVPATLPAGPVIVPLATWIARSVELEARPQPAGVWLRPDDDPAALAADLGALPIVAIHFPRFADGRGYSTAFLLRTRLGYRGELRAIGDVGRDQLFYLTRLGFDSFKLPPHRDPEAALAGFADFGETYQASVTQPLPLFRRRGPGLAA
jgi:uncharacterized protein (DUF934 family)